MPFRRPIEAVAIEPAGNPKNAGWLMAPVGTSRFSRVRVTTTAVNILIATPMASVEAKPTISVAPKLLPNAYRTEQVISVEIFESRIDGHARFQPTSMADASNLPARNSSLMRSKMSTLASTAIPIERTKPAMPASDNVTANILKRASVNIAYRSRARSARMPGKR